jgi:hypothetical protein
MERDILMTYNFGKSMLTNDQQRNISKWIKKHPEKGYNAIKIRKVFPRGAEVVFPAAGGKRMTRKARMSRKRKTMRRRR